MKMTRVVNRPLFAPSPNPALQPTAGKRRLPVPWSLRSAAAAELTRWAPVTTRIAFVCLAIAALLLPVTSVACKPGPDFYYAKSPGALAQNLMSRADLVVYAKVIKAWVVPPQPERRSRDSQMIAEIEVVEHFVGPRDVVQIHTWTTFATCGNPAFVSGEVRLFALYDPLNGQPFSEIHAWRNPRFTEEQVLIELRQLRDAALLLPDK
jgi:hypothetical protein